MSPLDSVNFVACHDGFTPLRPRVLRPQAQRGQRRGRARRHRPTTGRGTAAGRATTACPPKCSALRRRQLRNVWCLLSMSTRHADGRAWATSSGAPSGATTTPTTRTTRRRGSTGRGPPSGPISSASPPRCWRSVTVIRACRSRMVGRRGAPSRSAAGPLDDSFASRSLAWSIGDLYVIANVWWEPFGSRSASPGPGGGSSTRRCRPPTTSPLPASPSTARPYDVAPRSVVILERD